MNNTLRSYGLLIIEAATLVLTLVSAVIVTRELSPFDRGNLAFLVTSSGFMTIVSSLFVSSLEYRLLSSDFEVRESMWSFLIIGSVACLAYVSFWAISAFRPDLVAMNGALLLINVVFGRFVSILHWVAFPYAIMFIGSLVYLGFNVLAAAFGRLDWFLHAYTGANFLMALGSLATFIAVVDRGNNKRKKPALETRPKELARTRTLSSGDLSLNFRSFVQDLCLNSIMRLPILISGMMSPADSAQYRVSFTLVELLLKVPRVAGHVLRVSWFTSLKSTNVSGLIKWYLVLWVPTLLLSSYGAFLQELLFGAPYATSATISGLVLVTPALGAYIYGLSYFAVASSYDPKFTVAAALISITGIVLFSLMIFSGERLASIFSLVFTSHMLFFVLLRRISILKVAG